MSNKVNKPTQIILNLNQKAEILKKSDSGVNGKRLALDYGVTEAAISKIKKKREDILNAVSNTLESALIHYTNQNMPILRKMCMNGF